MIRRTATFALIAAFTFATTPGFACTGISLDAKEGISYATKYSMVGANAVGQTVIMDGMNDQGLSFGLFYFPGFAEYPAATAENAARAMAPVEVGAWGVGHCV